MNIAIIGAGVSGLAMARMLERTHRIKIFEKDARPGGLIKCTEVDGHLYHRVGGHVFNSRRQDVLDWFWQYFDRDNDFLPARRNAVISLEEGECVGYPIENHLYQMPDTLCKAVVRDLLHLSVSPGNTPGNFEDFLLQRFGETLYRIYFEPYNRKVWRRSLREIPLTWLEGKLPMPTVEEILLNNFHHADESTMVHSSFYYAKRNGSQFLADTLAKNIDIQYGADVSDIRREGELWCIAGEMFDRVVYTGNARLLPDALHGDIGEKEALNALETLEYHGTTSVLCAIDPNPYSWIYMPSVRHDSHRIICTGNFSPNNNAHGLMTGTIEFTDSLSREDIDRNLEQIPFGPRYLAHHYEQYTYPVQNGDTRKIIDQAKEILEPKGFYLLGRFAEWEYYNMDAAIGAALDLSKRFV